MTLGDFMTRSVVTVHMDDTIQRIQEIFEESHFHHVLVTDGGKVVGVISDRDLLKHLSPFAGNALMERKQDLNLLKRKVHQIMNRKPVVASPDMSVSDATELLLREHIGCLPIVTPDRRVCGVVTWRDLLAHSIRGDRAASDAA
jgi:acetoin utilization protein AcuB